jgi:hypothetical protein
MLVGVWRGSLKGKKNLESLNVGRRIIENGYKSKGMENLYSTNFFY